MELSPKPFEVGKANDIESSVHWVQCTISCTDVSQLSSSSNSFSPVKTLLVFPFPEIKGSFLETTRSVTFCSRAVIRVVRQRMVNNWSVVKLLRSTVSRNENTLFI
jgi:hypothetical protein